MDLGRAVIVVAHPDDEILWFSSVAAKVGRIIMCYGAVARKPERAAQRRRVVEAYPLHTVKFFDLPEPGQISADTDAEHRLALVARLREALRDVTTVFTHNTWGEYGHEDHRRVNAAIIALQGEMNFAVYVSCYVERRMLGAFDSALNQGIAGIVSFPINRAEIDPIFALYNLHSCWTWTGNWSWPKEEHFFRVGGGVPIRATPIPIHLFDIRF